MPTAAGIAEFWLENVSIHTSCIHCLKTADKNRYDQPVVPQDHLQIAFFLYFYA